MRNNVGDRAAEREVQGQSTHIFVASIGELLDRLIVDQTRGIVLVGGILARHREAPIDGR
jgi:hypothetical protein